MKKASNYICKLNTGEELSSGWQENFFHAKEYIWIVGKFRKLTFITKMFRNGFWVSPFALRATEDKQGSRFSG